MTYWKNSSVLFKPLIIHLRSVSHHKVSTAIRKLHMSENTSLVAICQLNSTNNKDANFNVCKNLIIKAAKNSVKMVFLPEAFDFISENEEESLKLSETLDGETVTKFKELALSNDLWLSLGGFHERINDSQIANTHIIINNAGDIVGTYKKVHLFDVNLPTKFVTLQESKTVNKGRKIVPPVSTPFGSIGLSICYDLRFPEMSMMLTKMGASILTYPSAFTYSTGSLHWETLLRARAIENQVYVVAAGQCGRHNSKRISWGHSMVVDPNGTIITQCPEGVGYSLALIDTCLVNKIRQEMPVWNQRRYDLYPPMLPYGHKENIVPESAQAFYQFGQVTVHSDAIFYKTDLTMAFTNKRCIVPGHVLVAPLRVVSRLCEMSQAEISDLIQVVQKVEGILEKVVGSSSSTVAIQDGPHAGQTIKHVHVHILPRKPGDFDRNDDIYYELEKHDKFDDIPQRTEKEMVEEALLLRKHF